MIYQILWDNLHSAYFTFAVGVFEDSSVYRPPPPHMPRLNNARHASRDEVPAEIALEKLDAGPLIDAPDITGIGGTLLMSEQAAAVIRSFDGDVHQFFEVAFVDAKNGRPVWRQKRFFVVNILIAARLGDVLDESRTIPPVQRRSELLPNGRTFNSVMVSPQGGLDHLDIGLKAAAFPPGHLRRIMGHGDGISEPRVTSGEIMTITEELKRALERSGLTGWRVKSTNS